MLHYVKGVTGVKYTPMYRAEFEMQTLEVYAEPFQKYKEWDFFILICFLYYRTKIAKERLWKHSYHSMPYEYEIYTDKELKNHKHLIVKDDESLWMMPKVVVTLSDGTEETMYFDSNEEAEASVASLIKDWGLKQYFELNTWKYPINN